jgi:hypothetical protein
MVSFAFAFEVYSQSAASPYPVSSEFRKAVSDQTRTLTGLPGRAYWQNSTDYFIDAVLDTKKLELSGSLEAVYYNNSPDTLDRLVFNLYQDIFRKGNSRDWDLGKKDLHDGMLISNILINGIKIDVKDFASVSRSGTKLLVKNLNLIPAGKHHIKIDFSVKLPEHRTVRMGKYSDSVIFVAYWYPQIAVYDDLDGWDMISYGGSVEFYQDINNYQVSLRVPAEFNVWATGFLQNPEEVYPIPIYKRYLKSLESDEVVRIITAKDLINNKQASDRKFLVWKYQANEVPDFSFAAAIGHLWDGRMVKTDPHNRQTFVESVYPANAAHWDKVAGYAAQSITDMSFRQPAHPFPYPKMTNFCNGRISGGMETPMMANNSAPSDAANLFGLTYHEIAHSYVPFFMGTNEKKYAWMDEGWASLWPAYLVDSLFSDYGYMIRTMATFQDFAGKELDIPPMVPNHLLSASYPALRHSSYVRPAVAFYFMEIMLGSEVYKQSILEFMHRWKGRHPHPLDLFYTIEQVADMDLAWFIKPWFYETAYPDLAVRKITNDRKIVVENIGGLPMPVELMITYTNGSQENYSLPVSVWSQQNKYALAEIKSELPIREVVLGNQFIPDTWKKNNVLLIID